MQGKSVALAAAAVVLFLFLGWSVVRAGDLEPSGPPTSGTMKTLDEVEPRIPISTAPYTIDQPGSYYLTNNLSSRIIIDSDDVTLDLMGYTITASTTDGIESPSPGRRNLLIRNGAVRLTGSTVGVDLRYSVDSNNRVENLRVEGNGSTTWAGMYLGSGCIVENCQVTSCDDYGINIGGSGNTEVRKCTIYNNNLNGLRAINNVRVVDNVIVDNGIGLSITGSGCYVANNIVKGNGDNYDLAAGNQLNLLLGEIPETIDQPAVVTLIGSLKGVSGQNGITIDADDVTIDMAGHTIEGVAGSLDGIVLDTYADNIEIRNGTVRNFAWGIIDISPTGHGQRIIDMRLIENTLGGVNFDSERNVIKGCYIADNAESASGYIYCIETGGESRVIDNVIQGNAKNASGHIYCLRTSTSSIIKGNILDNNGNGCTGDLIYGISASAGSIVSGNTVSTTGYNAAVSVYALSASGGCVVKDNACYWNGFGCTGPLVYGIKVGEASTVIGNSSRDNGRGGTAMIFGINLGGQNLVDQNSAYFNTTGSGVNMNSCTTCEFGVNRAP